MLKNAQSNGYSSKVRGWLVIAGARHELAQVGPDFCIVREPIVLSQTQAELVVEVDGDQKSTPVQIAINNGQANKRITYTRPKNR